MLRRLILPAMFALLSGALYAQALGSPLPRLELQGLSQTPAKLGTEFEGRALLLEFFAHW